MTPDPNPLPAFLRPIEPDAHVLSLLYQNIVNRRLARERDAIDQLFLAQAQSDQFLHQREYHLGVTAQDRADFAGSGIRLD